MHKPEPVHLTGLKFSISKIGCLTKAKELSLPLYLLTVVGGADGFMSFQRAWVVSETLIMKITLPQSTPSQRIR